MTSRALPGWVFYISVILLAVFVVIGAYMPDRLTDWSQEALKFTTLHFGWLYLFATTGFLIFCIYIAFTDYGLIRLGTEGEEPEFSYLAWLGMIFSAGMGVGLVFWGVAEPMTHYIDPPLNLAEARTPQAANVAFRYSLFHWGFHQWANFAIVGLAIAFVRFRLRHGGLFSETFRSTLGNRVDGPLGYAIDILAVISTTFGVATTLGLGTIQINSGLSTTMGIAFGSQQQLAILGGIALVFILCALTPLERGVRYISNLNMLIAAALLLFVFFAGPTPFITAVMTTSVGEYFSHMIDMSLAMSPFTGDDWVERWTIFYWAWGLSWAPFVGSFIARISRGRTIREFILGVIGVPVVLSIAWFATFGGTAFYFEMFADAGIADAVSKEISSALFTTLDQLPLPQIIGPLAVILIILFVITSANSATFVLGMFTTKGVLDPRRLVRVTWGGIQVMVAAVLLMSGGLAALQTMSIIAAFPFMIMMIFMAGALLRGLQDERRKIERRERELREGLKRLLAESAAADVSTGSNNEEIPGELDDEDTGERVNGSDDRPE
ncbi:MAG TPA: BCCT family transporter [Gammaproteobacteria bacterium]|nr:BCCT family transporter [Gammaproteobacteria bacterium]